MARHQPESAAAVLLSKWLGDIGADLMASMVGSESMTSTDWMLLALSNMGQGSQKKVGEAFVQRLLEKGDIHPAVAIFLGLGEHNDAIEVYVSRKYYMEAILLTCLIFPTDWQRQSYLVRKWGEHSVSHGKAELAVRCFSCMGLETTEPWFSPRAQDAVFSAQKQALLGSQLSPPLSPPSAGNSRVAARMASLKLVTDFNRGPQPKQILGEDDDRTPMKPGVTPIAESALSPSGGQHPWRAARDASREPSSARTATPGAYRRKRLPSRSDAGRSTTNNENLASLALPDRGQRGDIPRTAIDNDGREEETLPFSTRRKNTANDSNEILLSAATYAPAKTLDHLPSPAVGVFETLSQKNRERSESRGGSRSRKPHDLHLNMADLVVEHAPETGASSRAASPPLTNGLQSAKVRSIDQYISSLDEANNYTRTRAESNVEERPASRTARARSRARDESQSRGRSGVRYIRPAKRSPSSPVPMSPEDAGLYAQSSQQPESTTETYDDERFYKMSVASPMATESIASTTRTTRSRARQGVSKTRSSSKVARRAESPDGPISVRARGASRASSRRPMEDRGRSAHRGDNSPASPQSMHREEAEVVDYEPVRPRHRSTSRRPGASTRRDASAEPRAPRDRSVSRRPTPAVREASRTRAARDASPDSMISGRSGMSRLQSSTLSRREQAAKELADRRLSLARRPSAPVIPDPGEFAFRPVPQGRSSTDDMLSTIQMYHDPIQRSQTADPQMLKKHLNSNKFTGTTSTSSVPIGLPANPRAMRHPRYITADPSAEDDIPAVPTIPDGLQSKQEQQAAPQDDLGPLLPATTFGQPIAPPRAASAPPQDLYPAEGFRKSPSYPLGRRPSVGATRGHSRQNTSPEMLLPTNYKRNSPPPITASIAETIHESDVVIIEAEDAAPPILSQLQHLATPPPPPPPPLHLGSNGGNLGMINIVIDENAGEKQAPTNTSTAGSPPGHRRGRGSVSDNLGMTFKRVTERMRSSSRSGAKSPPTMRAADITPYESVPEFAYPRGVNTRSPSIDAGNNDSYLNNNNIPPPPPPPPPPGGLVMEQVIPPSESQPFYKHPKELRANMPPATLQPGVYQPDNTPMI